MRIMMFVLAALVVAAGTGFYLFRELQAPVARPAAVAAVKATTIDVFVPATELVAGAIIQPDKLGRLAMPEKSITSEMIQVNDAGKDLLTGSVARQVLPVGMPIARSATVQPGDRGFLAAVLPQGKRAISIAISETAGLSGLVLPGDWVDLILTYSLEEDDGRGQSVPGRTVHASETVARNIRVLALDNRVSHKPVSEKDGKTVVPEIPRTATLQVSPREAEEITLASALGSLSLALNSVRDGGEAADVRRKTERVALGGASLVGQSPVPTPADMTLDSDVTSLLRSEVQRTVPEQVSRIQVVRGASGSGVTAKPLSAEAAESAPAEAAATQ